MSRVHSHYQRTLLDLPWSGVTLRLDLHVRRFFCDALTCERKIFTERLPELVAPYARRTHRLDTWFTLVGFALGGEAGARLLRELGATSSPDTLLRHVRAVPVHPPAPGMVIGIDECAYVPYLCQRWNEGCRNGAQIYEELHEQGIIVSVRTVSRSMMILQGENGVPSKWASVAPQLVYIPQVPPPASVTPRQGAILFAKASTTLTQRQQEQLAQMMGRDADLQPIYDLVQAFGAMVRTQGGIGLDAWLQRAESSGCMQLHAFAKGLRQDLDAVHAGLTEQYSQGPVEGQVHRVKLIKRSGYGRIGFPLLRHRVLVAHAS